MMSDDDLHELKEKAVKEEMGGFDEVKPVCANCGEIIEDEDTETVNSMHLVCGGEWC